MRRPVLLLAALGGLGWACASDPPAAARPPPDVRWVTPRALIALGDAPEPFRPALDDERPPILWVAGPVDGLSAEWQAAAGASRLLAVGEGRAAGDAALVELIPLGAVPPGAGELVVSFDGRPVHRAPAIWALPPGDAPPALDGDPRALTRRAIRANREGRYAEAIERMVEASGRWLAAGHGSDAIACLGAAAHYARHRRRLELAAGIEAWNAALIDAVGDESGRHASAYRQGLLDIELGRFRAAEASLLSAAAGVEAIGLDRHGRVIRQALANLFERLGRHGEALAIHEGFATSPDDPQDAFRTRINRAWVRLQAMRAGALPADYPAVQRAFAVEAEAMPAGLSPTSRANLYANLALAALQSGAFADARAALDDARRADPDGGGLWPAFLELLDGELALAEGRAKPARDAFRRAGERARSEVDGGDSIEAWQALYGQGRAALADGDPDAALELWREALAMTRRLAGRTPLSTSHSAFLADRRALVDDLVGMLLERGAIPEAFRALDATRAPTLRALAADARLDGLDPGALGEWRRRVSDWGAARQAVARAEADLQTAPLDEQTAARQRLDAARRDARARFDDAFGWLDERAPLDGGDPGEPTTLLPPDMALIAFARIGEDWHGFMLAGGRLGHRRSIAPEDPLGPWRAALLEQRRIYIVDGGLDSARGLAARPTSAHGPPWGEHTELVWLPYAGWLRGRSAELPDGPPLVVADPDGTLPASRRAATAIAERTQARALVGEAASRQAVLAALDGARWFHFDGHGVLGRGEPWQAHLRMARDEILSLTDVLALRPRVGTVVLSGCETGVPEALSRVESLGLAEGFLLAGAQQVVAADRVLGVDEAARFVESFHRLGGAERPAAALRATIAEMRAAGDDAWRGWRVFGVPPIR